MPALRPLTTSRLTLIPATEEMLRADAADRARLATLLGAIIPGSWPQALFADALTHLDAWLKPDHLAAGWGVWYIVLRGPAPILIGTAGFKGPPGADGRVEVGYGVVEDHQRLGYASEATSALVDHAFARGVRTVLAHTFERLTPSIGVLNACGFRRAGPGFEQVSEEEARGLGQLLLFRRDRSPPAD
jgi:RimJ/RimL family protein N-acetyltransferase